MITNAGINKKFKLTAKLLELHGENEFKLRSYTKAVDTIGALERELSELTPKEISELDGIGKSTAVKIGELIERGSFAALDTVMENTPVGVVEMLRLAGFGSKKILVLWKDGGAENVEQVKELCLTGQAAILKGFGDKSQETLLKSANFLLKNRGYFRYANIEPTMKALVSSLKEAIGSDHVSETGEMRRRMEVINVIEIVAAGKSLEQVRDQVNSLDGLEENPLKSGPYTWAGIHQESEANVKVYLTLEENFVARLFQTTGSTSHLGKKLSDGSTLLQLVQNEAYTTESELYKAANLPYIEPELREGVFEIEAAQSGKLPELVKMDDLKGILHNHSTYSDGKNTLREMAEHCRDLGYEYLGITDHSQTAVYANGLQEFRVKEQQEEIKQLNEELSPFKIFSGIESDILSDGSLDYSDEVLSSFDFIVSSVHSGQNMDMEKATDRLITAVTNPHTTILGHMTGRLLLEREGYPVDHKAVIDACIEHNVVIEINASPYRLDIDWRWVHYGIENGLMLSINPDAHKKQGYQDMYYGVLAGRKGGLTPAHTLNSKSLQEIEDWFSKKKLTTVN